MAKKPVYSAVRMELAKKVQNTYTNLINRIKRIENKGWLTPARTALEEKGLDKISVKNLTSEQLGQMLNDLTEISQYPTSRLTGKKSRTALENYNKYVARWINLFDNDKDTYDRVMKIYGRMVNENEWTEHVKYQVLEELMDRVGVSGMNDEALHNYIRMLVDNAYKTSERINADIQGGRAYAINGKVRYRR